MKNKQYIINNDDEGSSSNEVKSRFKEFILKIKLKNKKNKNNTTNINKKIPRQPIIIIPKPRISKQDMNTNKPSQPIVIKQKPKKIKTITRLCSTDKKEQSIESVENISKQKDKTNINNLNSQIIKKISKRLIKYLDEIEIIESELHLIKEVNKEETTIIELNKTKEKINILLNKIYTLKEQYKQIKDYVDKDYFIDYNNDFLEEDISYLKQLANSSEINQNKTNIKHIKEYQLISLELEVIEAKVKQLDSIKEKKKEELNLRDNNYQKLLNNYINNETISEECKKLMELQEKTISSINIKDIEKITNTTTKLVGIGEVFKNGLKYLFTLINPFRYTHQGIAESTILAKSMVDNAIDNIHIETKTQIIYKAIDYSNEIDKCLESLEYTSNKIDDTLENISYLKDRYIKELLKYKYEVPKIAKTYQDIIKLEELLLSNKRKTEIMINKTNKLDLVNKKRLEKVKKLNKENTNK